MVDRVCQDKWLMYNYLITLGLKQPTSYIDLDKAIAALQLGFVQFPLVLKSRWQHDIEDVTVDSHYQLIEAYTTLNKRVNELNTTEINAVDKESCVLIQEEVTGIVYDIVIPFIEEADQEAGDSVQVSLNHIVESLVNNLRIDNKLNCTVCQTPNQVFYIISLSKYKISNSSQ